MPPALESAHWRLCQGWKVESQPQALFDNLTLELVGAKCILESKDMQQFLLLSKLK